MKKKNQFITPVLILLDILVVIILARLLFSFVHSGPSLQPAMQLPVATSTVVTETPSSSPATTTPELSQYIEVLNGCGPYWSGEEGCVNVRSGPGLTYPVVAKLRTGVVLKVSGTVSGDGHDWYHVVFDEWVRYPNRITSDWYIAADFVRSFSDVGTLVLGSTKPASTTKLILVDRSEQMLYAYDGTNLFMKAPVSTGLPATPTPRGQFYVYKKTPSRYMQGPLPGISDQYYDLPGVPWNLFFTYQGAVVHGAYWHDKFGQVWSHGCVNVSPTDAETLYHWAELGTPVFVRD